MTLNAITQTLTQPGANLDHVLGMGPDNGIALSKPLNPPGKWTRFLAVLSHVPLLGRLGSLQQARSECAAYPVRLAQFQATNRQILAGLVADLRAQYGEQIAAMALRDLGPSDGAPLTGRKVSTVLQNAEKAQANCRARNNQSITRFLEENIAEDGHARAGTNMNTLCREWGIGGEHSDGWQHAVGPHAMRFLAHETTAHCKALPEYSTGQLNDAQIAQAANLALDRYQELLQAPGMTPLKLDALAERAFAASGRDAGQPMTARMREQLIVEGANELMGRHAPDSMLSRLAREVTEGQDRPALPEAVLQSVADVMAESLRQDMGPLSRMLGCAPDISTIMQALGPWLEMQVRNAFEQHLEALALLNRSTALSPAAQTLLQEAAATRHLDPAQIAAHETFSRDMPGALGAFAHGLERHNPVEGLKQLHQALNGLEARLTSMDARGQGVQGSGASRLTPQLLRAPATLLAQSYTPQEAKRLLDALSGPEGARLLGGLHLAVDRRLAQQCVTLYATLIEPLAVQAGGSPEQAREIVRNLLDPQQTASGRLSGPLAHYLLTSDPGAVDARGVVIGSPNGGLVSDTFDPHSVVAGQREEISKWVLRDPSGSEPWLSRTLSVDANRATYYLDGEMIGEPGGESDATLKRFRAAFPPGPEGDAMALAVGRCANQIGINTLFEISNQAAFPGRFGSFTGGSISHEISRNDDGSWSVRSIHTSRPNALVSTETGEMTEVETRGVALYAMSYRIDPPVLPDDQPVVSIVDSQVVFNI